MNISAVEPALPLHELFTRLRLAGLPLGIDEYQELLVTLQGGFGMQDSAALARVCKTLWTKSAEDAHLFDYHFEQIITSFAVPEPPTHAEQPARNAEEVSPSTNPPPPPTTPEPAQASNPPAAPSSAPEKNASPPAMPTEMILELQDEVQVAQALSHATDEAAYFLLSDEYFPITRRQMKQSWRYLRRPVRQGPLVEIDIEATVDMVGRQGILLEPVLAPRRINRVELLLFLDQGGSMLPFHLLSQRLAETAIRGGRLERTKTYYFHNCPIEYLYHDPAQLNAIPLQEVIHSSHLRYTNILIFSDAGAARGGHSDERIKMTADFLHQLKQHVQHIVWLNPMPRERWPRTTAGKILTYVPMFDLSRRGLDAAISTLLGRFVPYPHREDEIDG